MEESCGLLEKGSHLGTLVNRSLYGQETAIQLVDQAHVHHVAEGNKPKCIRFNKKHLNDNHINHFLEWILGIFIVNICFLLLAILDESSNKFTTMWDCLLWGKDEGALRG